MNYLTRLFPRKSQPITICRAYSDRKISKRDSSDIIILFYNDIFKKLSLWGVIGVKGSYHSLNSLRKSPFILSGAKLRKLYFYSTTQMLQNRNILKSRLFILVLKAIKLFSVRFEIYILNFRT